MQVNLCSAVIQGLLLCFLFGEIGSLSVLEDRIRVLWFGLVLEKYTPSRKK